MKLRDRLLRHTVWAKDGIQPEDWKFRDLQRIWLPLYDLVALYAGLMGMLFGSPLLQRILGGEDHYGYIDPIDVFTGLFALTALFCLISVIHPRLWALEIASKFVLVGMIVGYIAAIVIFGERAGGLPNLFVTGMLAFGLPLALFRLDVLGQEMLDRRMVRAIVNSVEA